MQQIFINILSNAVKFTPAGGKIHAEVECLQRNKDCSSCRISIEDNGIGISEDFLPHLFEPFEQEKTEVTPTCIGTGLGLSIVKNLVELMGGTVSAESKVGFGTKITVFVDVERIDEPLKTEIPVPIQSTASLQNKCILLAEDHPLNTQIATKLLENEGMRVVHAENGRQAVELFNQSPEGYYNGILMDIRMPLMNGLEATKVIRSLNRSDSKTIPIIAMTANAFEEDVKTSLAAGMNAHIAKPIDPQRLYIELSTYLHKSD